MQPRDLSAHEPYEPGRGIEEVARELGRDPGEFLKLASNENPLGPSPAAAEAIREGAGEVHVYPTAAHTDLRDALADRWGVDPRQVWLGPGADGVLDFLARAVVEPGDAVLTPEPGFAYYPMSARYHHGTVETYRIEGPEFEQTPEAVLSAYDGERVVYLTSPNNPTGGTFSPAAVERVAEATGPETLVVVDEAYGEFATLPSAAPMVGGRERAVEDPDGEPFPAEVGERDDVAVVRTFSKAYGLAGMRVGYGLVPGSWADAYARVNTPFSVGELSCRAALAALEDDDHVRRSRDAARRSRRRLARDLAAPVIEGAGNFVLVDVGDAGAVAEACKHEGLIVRDCTSFGLPGHVRVTCGTAEGTERAVRTINGVLDG